MQLISTSFHRIDHDNSQVFKVKNTSQNEQLDKYVKSLLRTVTETKSKRSFTFRSDTTEVRKALDLMLNSKFQEGARINAERLLFVEKSAQESYAQITEIQKGVLFQASLIYESKQTVVVSKADHSDFLDENELSLRRGLPLKRQLFKAMAVSFDSRGSVDTVFVMDNNRKISKYWWDTYLELKEKYNDTYNTKSALGHLHRSVLNPMKTKSPADYTILKNSTIGYFRNQNTFDIVHYVESVIKGYDPVNNKIDPQVIESKILALPEKKDFDEKFSIDKAEVKYKMSSKIALTESIDLVLKENINDLPSVIQAEEDKEGRKYIKIRTNKGYEWFKR